LPILIFMSMARLYLFSTAGQQRAQGVCACRPHSAWTMLNERQLPDRTTRDLPTTHQPTDALPPGSLTCHHLAETDARRGIITRRRRRLWFRCRRRCYSLPYHSAFTFATRSGGRASYPPILFWFASPCWALYRCPPLALRLPHWLLSASVLTSLSNLRRCAKTSAGTFRGTLQQRCRQARDACRHGRKNDVLRAATPLATDAAAARKPYRAAAAHLCVTGAFLRPPPPPPPHLLLPGVARAPPGCAPLLTTWTGLVSGRHELRAGHEAILMAWRFSPPISGALLRSSICFACGRAAIRCIFSVGSSPSANHQLPP